MVTRDQRIEAMAQAHKALARTDSAVMLPIGHSAARRLYIALLEAVERLEPPAPPMDFRTLRHVACEYVSIGSGFNRINDRDWQQFADALNAFGSRRL